MPKKTSVRTGGKAPMSAQYRPRGYKTEITLSKGDTAPPFAKKAVTFVVVDPTKHKRKA